MASSMMTGDRRWAPTRKGMTVLGKVPKPINLPSQRLENHGLNPNVEIVPKGTLTWGSRPSSTVQNAWGSSALLSPNIDRSSGSPSHVNGRPSSGESGTRPSTASSDRSHDPASNAWGPNSRPSSASGPLTSNQTSIMVTRPRSAETRPSSTQLSRFAESPVESTVAWGATRTAERVGAASSKNNAFTLSSGDFPTLGSDKNSESQMQRGHSSHGRPGSASGLAATQQGGPRPLSAGDGSFNAYSDHGIVNSWKDNGFPCVGGDAPPNSNRQWDSQHPQPNPSANIPPHQFGTWHSAPVPSPNGVWYRGGAVCGPYRPAGPHGSYPIEPYAHYPQFPARPPPNSEPAVAPRPGPSPGGYHPNNGDSYHHHQPPDSYMIPSHPVIPVRPGLYPSPVTYEGYYAPPHASFCNRSEGDAHFMGISDQPGAYDQSLKQNAILDPEKFHARSGGHAPVTAKEQKESGHTHESRPGQYKVLMRQHDCWEDKTDAQEKRGQFVIAGPQHLDRGILQGAASQEEDWRKYKRKDERTVFLNLVPRQEASSDRGGHISDSVITNSLANSSKKTDDSLIRKPETATFRVHDRKQNLVSKKNATLLVKRDDLNSESPNFDGHNGGEKAEHSKVANKADHSTKLVSTNATSTEYAPSSDTVTSDSGKLDASMENRNRKSSGDGNVIPRTSESLVRAVSKSDSSELGEKAPSQVHRRDNVMRGRVDDHAKLRSSSQDDDEWIKKSPGRDSLVMSTMTSGEINPEATTGESHHAADTAGVSYATSSLDSIDHKAQRAKLKELAMRRAKELQEEEEARTREQKARALAKLEELNKRALVQSVNQKICELPPNSDVKDKQEEEERTREQKARALAKLEELNKQALSQSVNQKNHELPANSDVKDNQDSETDADVRIDAIIIGSLGPISAQNSNSMTQANDSEIKNLAGLTDLPSDTASQDTISATQDSATPHDPSLSLGKEKSTDEVFTHVTSSDFNEKPITTESMGIPEDIGEVASLTLSSDSLPNSVETSVHHRKRSNKNARNKNRLDETLTSASREEGSIEGGNAQSSSGQTSITMITSSNQGRSQATEKLHDRLGNQWKRKTTRNQPAVGPVDKFHGSEAAIWAPVRPPNKTEPSEKVIEKSHSESHNRSSGKHGQDTQNGMKTKRSEMERYVRKPVAKEPSQQDNSQEPSATNDQAAIKGFQCGTLDESALRKPEFATDAKNREVKNKPSRRGKMRASWRQRIPAESPSGLQSSSLDSVPTDEWNSKNGDSVPTDEWNSKNGDSVPTYEWNSKNGDSVPTDEWNSKNDYSVPTDEWNSKNDYSVPTDEWNSKNNDSVPTDEWNSKNDNSVPTEYFSIPTVINDHTAPSRQRRQKSLVHGVQASNYAHAGNKDQQSGANDDSDTRSQALNLNESDQRNASRTRSQSSGGEHTRYHWKPKNQSYSNHPHENRGDGGQSIEESESQGIESYSLQDEYIQKAMTQRTGDARRSNARYRETASREKKIIADQSKEETPSGDHDLFCKQIDHVNGGDKRKGNSHLEYRRNVSYDKAGDSIRQNPVIGGEASDGPRAPGLRYRERGQNHSRRGGHVYRQRTGAAVQVGDLDSYNRGG